MPATADARNICQDTSASCQCGDQEAACGGADVTRTPAKPEHVTLKHDRHQFHEDAVVLSGTHDATAATYSPCSPGLGIPAHMLSQSRCRACSEVFTGVQQQLEGACDACIQKDFGWLQGLNIAALREEVRRRQGLVMQVGTTILCNSPVVGGV